MINKLLACVRRWMTPKPSEMEIKLRAILARLEAEVGE